MNKRTALTFGGIVLAIAVMSASTVIYFRHKNIPVIEEPVANEFSVLEKIESSSSAYSVPPIKVEPKSVIEEPAASKPEDTAPPEVAETTEPDGTVVQTPNWEAQKQLAPDTDISNPDSQPEYVKPTAPAASTPKNGATKTENGAAYTYLEGFGWVKNGGGNVGTVVDAPTTGEHVGY